MEKLWRKLINTPKLFILKMALSDIVLSNLETVVWDSVEDVPSTKVLGALVPLCRTLMLIKKKSN